MASLCPEFACSDYIEDQHLYAKDLKLNSSRVRHNAGYEVAV